MFSFFRKRQSAMGDLMALGVDMHAHWLPGIDDGAQTMQDSLMLIRQLVDLGYSKLIATPHVMADLYPNTKEEILVKLKEVRLAAEQAGIPVALATAAEYLIDEGFEQLVATDQLLTLPNRHLLVEFSFVSPPPTRDAVIFNLQTKGFVPVLAHPERYRYYHNTMQEYHILAARGVKLQVNLLSITGYYGESVKKVALSLIEEGLVDILGTDAHHYQHIEELQRLCSSGKLGKPVQSNSWQNQQLFG